MGPAPEVERSSIDGTILAVAVLNGWAHIGDTVAVAVRDGNLAAMRIGTVEGFTEGKGRYGRPGVVKMLLKVVMSGDFGGPSAGKVVRLEKIDRIAVCRQ